MVILLELVGYDAPGESDAQKAKETPWERMFVGEPTLVSSHASHVRCISAARYFYNMTTTMPDSVQRFKSFHKLLEPEEPRNDAARQIKWKTVSVRNEQIPC
jgi:hypothetical protein